MVEDLGGLDGRPVVTYDDEQLGTVARVAKHAGRRYLVVTSGLYGTGEYFVPESEIERVGPTRILLKTTRDDLQELDWFKAPVEGRG
jgi:ribosomal 30S subunit maturation factor RimM